MSVKYLSWEHVAAEAQRIQGMSENQRLALGFLFSKHPSAQTPTDIGAALGKGYNQASAYACRCLKPLLAAALVERVQVGRGAYRLTEVGWYAYDHFRRQEEHSND